MRHLGLLLILIVFLGSCQSKQVVRQREPQLLLDHKFFVISYNPEHRLANWVSYKLTATHLAQGHVRRKDRFYADPLLLSQNVAAAKPSDYEGSEYDRGHMAPSEDFIWSQEANDTTFVMSNMAPQSRKLNRGAWKVLEGKIRRWACTEQELQITTGPVLEKNLLRLPSQVSIPNKFFKIVYDLTPPTKAIAFLYNQTDAKTSPEEKVLPVSEIERLTGQNFLEDLHPNESESIKKSYDIRAWKETDCVRKSSKKN